MSDLPDRKIGKDRLHAHQYEITEAFRLSVLKTRDEMDIKAIIQALAFFQGKAKADWRTWREWAEYVRDAAWEVDDE